MKEIIRKIPEVEEIRKIGEIFDQITTAENEIEEKKKKRNKYFLTVENQRLENIKNKIQDYVKLMKEVISFKEMERLLNVPNIEAYVFGIKYRFGIYLDFKQERISLSYKKKDSFEPQEDFCLKITETPEWVNEIEPCFFKKKTLSCEQYEKIFKENTPEIILDVFTSLCNKIIYQLEEKFNRLRKEQEKIFVPPINEEKEDIEEQKRIIIGKFQGYSVILEKEGENEE